MSPTIKHGIEPLSNKLYELCYGYVTFIQHILVNVSKISDQLLLEKTLICLLLILSLRIKENVLFQIIISLLREHAAGPPLQIHSRTVCWFTKIFWVGQILGKWVWV